jgi:hypothetical protein
VWVDEQKMFQPFSSVIDRGQPVAQSRPPLQAVHTTPAVEENVPMLVKLLRAAHKVGPAEEQALKNQLLLYPDVALADLVLRAGYVTEAELKSLQLAEYWLTPSK